MHDSLGFGVNMPITTHVNSASTSKVPKLWNQLSPFVLQDRLGRWLGFGDTATFCDRWKWRLKWEATVDNLGVDFNPSCTIECNWTC